VVQRKRRGSANGAVIAWFNKELQDAKDFSINRLNSDSDLVQDEPVNQAISALDGAMGDMEDINHIISNEDPSALLTRDQAKQTVKGEPAATM
jgi:hypothetical protein